MSEPGPDSIPTSTHRRSGRPTKKRALTPTSQQSQEVSALFAHPERDIILPDTHSSRQTKTVAPPPEIVANVQGSSAGAGSGEFHVYKASRRREYERLRVMDEENEREKREEEFRAKRDEVKTRDEERLARNRMKREKAKARQARKKEGGGGDEMEDDRKVAENGGDGGGMMQEMMKKKLRAAKVAMPANGHADEDDGEGRMKDGQAAEEAGIVIHDED